MQGIDVSAIQGYIDWAKVKADDVDFAVVKATQGRGESALTKWMSTIKDSKFVTNILGASMNNLDTSVYHYLTATDTETALREADFFLSTIEPYHSKIKSYAAVDVESKYLNGLTPNQLATVVEAFIQQVYQAGYQPLVYTNPNFLRYRLPSSFQLEHDIWLAHWGVATPYKVPYLSMWQYGAGYVDGISGMVDLDVGYYEIREVKKVYRIGDKYTLKEGDVYSTGVKVPSRLVGRTYVITQVKEDRILLGSIASWVKI